MNAIGNIHDAIVITLMRTERTERMMAHTEMSVIETQPYCNRDDIVVGDDCPYLSYIVREMEMTVHISAISPNSIQKALMAFNGMPATVDGSC